MKAELEAKLLLGIDARPGKARPAGPDMDWNEFREQYRTLHLATVRDSTSIHTESRLDLAERILRPKSLADVADPNALQRLQARLLAGEQSRRNKPHSTHTVRGYMNSVLSVMNWAYLQGWLPTAPKLRKIKTPKQKAMKGRPITPAEFKKMLDATAGVVGSEAADSWQYVLRGLWTSALRLDELMHVSWDRAGTIRPVWQEGKHPVLDIPAAMQKNDTEESIPLHPWFEAVLLETPEGRRKGGRSTLHPSSSRWGGRRNRGGRTPNGSGRSSPGSGKPPGSKWNRPTTEPVARPSTRPPTTSAGPAATASARREFRRWSSAG